MAIIWTTIRQLFFWCLVTVVAAVPSGYAGEVGFFSSTISCAVISTIESTIPRDVSLAVSLCWLFKGEDGIWILIKSCCFISVLFYPYRFYKTLTKMGDNLRRAVQEINLGVDDIPFALPEAVFNQAIAANRFILFGRPVMPRRQNLRSIVASMPQIWGQAGLVHGRIVEGREFQFIFPTEESMETVLRRSPWAFNDRMLLLQRWSPQLPLLNFIPFWVQIRGIPFQFLNREVCEHIGRALAQVLDVDFDAETAARVDFVRVLLHWDINQPLKFQRYFQFTEGVNTLLRFRYERLRGFCEVCGMMTHDSGACLIQNGGEEQDEDDDDDVNPPPERARHNGIIIREIDDAENMEIMNQNADNQAADARPNGIQEVAEENSDPQSHGADLSDIDPNHDSLADYEHYDMLSGNQSHAAYSALIHPLALMDSEVVINPKETVTIDRGKRKREDMLEINEEQGQQKITAREKREGSGSTSSEPDVNRGVVGPQPPIPP